MKKRTRNLSICIALLLLIQTVFLTSASVSASSATPTGAGTSAEPYMLTSAEQFSFVASHPDSYFRMANDIDFSGISDFSAIPSFSGVLDGNGKEIQNLHISADGTENAALFNTVTSTGIIQDLTFINPQLSSSSGSGAGALAINLSGTVRNVGVIGGTISTTHSGGFAYAGGLAVYASAKLTGCFSVDTVITGISTAGGLIGQAHNYSCVNCYSTSTVNAPVGQTGGLIGVSFGGGALEHCYANGSVNGSPATCGGLIGVIRITPPNPQLPSLNDCYWDITATGQNTYAVLENYTEQPADLPDGAVGVGIPQEFSLTPSDSPAFIPIVTVPANVRINGSWLTDPYYSKVSIALNGAVSALYNGVSPVAYAVPVGSHTMTLTTQVNVIGAASGPSTVIAEIGNKNALVNGAPYPFHNNGSPLYINSALFVPVRFISEVMQYAVEWNDADGSITVTELSTGNYAYIQFNNKTINKYNSSGTLLDSFPLEEAFVMHGGISYAPADFFSKVWGLQINVQHLGMRTFILVSNRAPAWNSTQLSDLIMDAAEKL